jgi:acetoacetate decarboxylase
MDHAETTSQVASYPPMPWHLVTRGTTLVTLHRVDIRRARALVPPGISIVPLLPGWTIGGLFLAEYGPGSDLRYNELIAVGATVWHERKLCAWVTHLYVDSHASVEGGQRLLGAPKHFAPFVRSGEPERPQRVVVGDPHRPICRFESGRALWLWRQRARGVALHRDTRDASGASAVMHGNQFRGRIGLTRVRVEIPTTSPLHPLGFGQPIFSLCAREAEAVLGGATFHPARTFPVGAAAG